VVDASEDKESQHASLKIYGVKQGTGQPESQCTKSLTPAGPKRR